MSTSLKLIQHAAEVLDEATRYMKDEHDSAISEALAKVLTNLRILQERNGADAFTLYWRSGSRQTLQGLTIEDAFNRAGYGAGAIKALDFFVKGDDHKYKWNAESKEWI